MRTVSPAFLAYIKNEARHEFYAAFQYMIQWTLYEKLDHQAVYERVIVETHISRVAYRNGLHQANSYIKTALFHWPNGNESKTKFLKLYGEGQQKALDAFGLETFQLYLKELVRVLVQAMGDFVYRDIFSTKPIFRTRLY